MLPYTDYFLPSIEEARALTGISDISDVAKYFIDQGVKACVFTLGEDGAYYHDRSGVTFAMPAFDVAVKCTCGCGDAFNAGFAVGLVKGFDAEATVRFAQATAALNATGLGSQAGVVSFEHTLDFATIPHVAGGAQLAFAVGSGGQQVIETGQQMVERRCGRWPADELPMFVHPFVPESGVRHVEESLHG